LIATADGFMHPVGGGWVRSPMLDADTTALLRAVLDEVCENVSRYETMARTHVASKILEAARSGETSVANLRQVGRKALSDAPIMKKPLGLRLANRLAITCFLSASSKYLLICRSITPYKFFSFCFSFSWIP